MATEYGVFNAEGCIERQLWSHADAEDAARGEREAGDPDAYAAEMCEDHDGEPAFPRCEECAAE